MTSAKIKKTSKKLSTQDEFELYLKNQSLKTTFNGLELETFSWYKKMLNVK